MKENRAHRRKILIARGKMQWQDESGVPRRCETTIEDLSAGGAGIRVRSPVTVGTLVQIKWPKEEFAGLVTRCQRDGNDFVLGIRRVAAEGFETTAP